MISVRNLYFWLKFKVKTKIQKKTSSRPIPPLPEVFRKCQKFRNIRWVIKFQLLGYIMTGGSMVCHLWFNQSLDLKRRIKRKVAPTLKSFKNKQKRCTKVDLLFTLAFVTYCSLRCKKRTDKVSSSLWKLV